MTPTQVKLVIYGKGDIDERDFPEGHDLLTTGSHNGGYGSSDLTTLEPPALRQQPLIRSVINPASIAGMDVLRRLSASLYGDLLAIEFSDDETFLRAFHIERSNFESVIALKDSHSRAAGN